MRLLLSTPANPPFAFVAGGVVNYNRRNLASHRFFGRPRPLHRPVVAVFSKKASTGKPVGGLAKFSTYLHYLSSQFSNAFPLKDFPWDKAKLMAEERLIVLVKNAVQWSLVVLLCFSFVSDALMAVSINRELLVPLGLFMGVTFADFLNEVCQVISERSSKGGTDLQQLWGIGLFFVALRVIYLGFRIPGRVLFVHIGNGGLMQVLWLAKELQPAIVAQNKEEVDSFQLPSD